MENNQRNSRKRLNSLILLVAFTAVMLIVSTYAWFSAQKNVTIGGLKGTVNVAEGLEISLDAKYWSQEVNFGDTSKYASQNALKKLYGSLEGTAQDNDMTEGSPNHNIIPTELLPVSTTGNVNDGIGQQDMNFYRGINQNGNELYEIITVQKKTGDGTLNGDPADVYTNEKYAENATTPLTSGYHDYPGYYAIDLFLRNSTKLVSTSDKTGDHSVFDKLTPLQLNANSKLELQSAASNTTGLQNTVRVAFALYNMEETYDELTDVSWESGEDQTWNNAISKADCLQSAYMTASQKQILAAYAGQTIHDVAIWEPNSERHVQYVVSNNNNVTWDSTEQAKYGIPLTTDAGLGDVANKFKTTTPTPTYALTSTATSLTQADGADTGTGVGDSDTDTNTVKVGEGTGAQYVKGIQNIYNWGTTPADGLAKQVTLQTTTTDGETNFAVGKVKQLISVKSTAANRYTIGDSTESGATAFSIPQGKVCKVRMYVWLEGQDVDTINHASHGGGVYLDVGLIKDATAQS